MRKRILLPLVAIASIVLCTSFSGTGIINAVHGERNTTCSLSVTFYNESTTYTVPAVFFSDGAVQDDAYNVAPGTNTTLQIWYTTSGLEFNVQFNAPHPGGRVRLFKNGNPTPFACTVVPKNVGLVTLQGDPSPTCTDTYELRYQPIFTCP
jgi:hypothetical protein